MGIRGAIAQGQVWLCLAQQQMHLNLLIFIPIQQFLTDTAFAFFPALISWSAFRVFGILFLGLWWFDDG